MSTAVAYSILCVYVAALAIVGLSLLRRSGRLDQLVRQSVERAEGERKKKTEILEELARLARGLARPSEIQELDKQLKELNEAVQAERGKITITETEREALERRLRELEGVQRQLDESSRELITELEAFRVQEREIGARAQTLSGKLKESVAAVDLLLQGLAHSPQAAPQDVERLVMLRKELIDAQKRSIQYQEQIAKINAGYILLKKAYHLLDGEYAQHYEKQQGPA